jgi:hypothetical protein
MRDEDQGPAAADSINLGFMMPFNASSVPKFSWRHSYPPKPEYTCTPSSRRLHPGYVRCAFIAVTAAQVAPASAVPRPPVPYRPPPGRQLQLPSQLTTQRAAALLDRFSSQGNKLHNCLRLASAAGLSTASIPPRPVPQQLPTRAPSLATTPESVDTTLAFTTCTRTPSPRCPSLPRPTRIDTLPLPW